MKLSVQNGLKISRMMQNYHWIQSKKLKHKTIIRLTVHIPVVDLCSGNQLLLLSIDCFHQASKKMSVRNRMDSG